MIFISFLEACARACAHTHKHKSKPTKRTYHQIQNKKFPKHELQVGYPALSQGTKHTGVESSRPNHCKATNGHHSTQFKTDMTVRSRAVTAEERVSVKQRGGD